MIWFFEVLPNVLEDMYLKQSAPTHLCTHAFINSKSIKLPAPQSGSHEPSFPHHFNKACFLFHHSIEVFSTIPPAPSSLQEASLFPGLCMLWWILRGAARQVLAWWWQGSSRDVMFSQKADFLLCVKVFLSAQILCFWSLAWQVVYHLVFLKCAHLSILTNHRFFFFLHISGRYFSPIILRQSLHL